jgi:TolB-like protein
MAVTSVLYRFNECTLDLTRGHLLNASGEVDLRPKSFEVLRLLVENAGRLLSKEEIHAAVWPNIVVTDESLARCISDIRAAIGDQAQAVIKTVPRRGYRFAAEVTTAGVTLSRGPEVARRLSDRPSIAVMPFTNMSGDPEDDYFADGVVEDIITGLSRMRWLFVIARNSSFTYKGRAVDIRQVGRDLGVRYVLEGSIRKAGKRLRVTGQLIDASVGIHLWADRFDGVLEDVFEVQDQVTARVLGAVAPNLEQAEIERARRKPTESLDAYDFFLRGLASFHKLTAKDVDDAEQLWHRAIELDQDYASAYAMASMCYAIRKGRGSILDRGQEIAEATRLARQAVKCDRGDAIALSFAGYTLAYVAGQLDDGAAYLGQAVSLNPNLASARYLGGWVKVWLGEPDLAVEQFMHAMELSPVDPFLWQMLHGMAHAHFFAGRHEEAVARATMAMRENPESHAALRIAAASNALARRMEEAASVTARLRQLNPLLRVSNLRNTLGPYRDKKYLAMLEDALRRAGLPE